MGPLASWNVCILVQQQHFTSHDQPMASLRSFEDFNEQKLSHWQYHCWLMILVIMFIIGGYTTLLIGEYDNLSDNLTISYLKQCRTTIFFFGDHSPLSRNCFCFGNCPVIDQSVINNDTSQHRGLRLGIKDHYGPLFSFCQSQIRDQFQNWSGCF